MHIIEVAEWEVRRPFELNVSRGGVLHHEAEHVFGYNATVGTSLSTIWDGDTGTYIYPSSAIKMSVSSSSENDTALGTGARMLYIDGLDGNYNHASEIVTLNGQTAVTTVNSYLRLHRCDVVTGGSGGGNAGIVYVGTGTVTAGVPATKYAQVSIGYNSTLMGMWTVPAGYTAYMRNGSVSSGSVVNNKYLTCLLSIRPYQGVFNTVAIVTLNSNAAPFPFDYPVRIPQKTDIEARAMSSGDTFAVSSYFEIVYIKND